MNRGKHVRQDNLSVRKRSCRYLTLLLAMVFVSFGVAGGTLAWLVAETEPVVNTFTYGDIELKLEETRVDENGDIVDADNDGSPDKIPGADGIAGNNYKMIPGKEYLKDPTVTVLAGNEACWLFVKLVEDGGVTFTEGDGSTTTYGFDDYLTYQVAVGDDAWSRLLDDSGTAVEGIYFRYVEKDTDNTEVSYKVLRNNRISVRADVTKDMLNRLDNNGQNAADATYPSLSVTAYAVQYSGFEPEMSEGTNESTPEQRNAAALKAWQIVEEQETTANP